MAGEAAVYQAQGEFERAGDHYREAANLFESSITTPEYLLNAGQAYEEGGAYAKAIEGDVRWGQPLFSYPFGQPDGPRSDDDSASPAPARKSSPGPGGETHGIAPLPAPAPESRSGRPARPVRHGRR